MVSGRTSVGVLGALIFGVLCLSVLFYTPATQAGSAFSKSDVLTWAGRDVDLTWACTYYDSNFAATADASTLAAAPRSMEWVNKQFVAGDGRWEALTDYVEYEPVFGTQQVCEDVEKVVDNLTGETATEKVCRDETVQTGTREIAKQRWEQYNWDHNALHLRFCADLVPVLGPRAIEHVPAVAGYSFPEYDWWNQSWSRMKTVTVNFTQGAETNYPVLLNITYDDDMRTDFGDLRLVQGGQALPYWVQYNKSGIYADVWVNVTMINDTDSGIDMYYGNSVAISTSAAYGTFTVDMSLATTNGWARSTSVSNQIRVIPAERVIRWDAVESDNQNELIYFTVKPGAYDNFSLEFFYNYTAYSTGSFGLAGFAGLNYSCMNQGTGSQTNSVCAGISVPALYAHTIESNTDGRWYNTSASLGDVAARKEHFRMTLQKLGTNITWYVWNMTAPSQNVMQSAYPRNFTKTNANLGFFVVSGGQGEPSGRYVSGYAWNMIIRPFHGSSVNIGFGPEESNEIANENDGRDAIEDGMIDALGIGSWEILTDGQLHVRYPSGLDSLGTFDKIAVWGNKTWAFNYVTGAESYAYLSNLTPTVYIWEKQNMTVDSITASVAAAITTTKYS